MLLTPEFWVFIAFILLLATAGKKAIALIKQSLDEHSERVAQQLSEAQRLHDEALSLLETYKKKHQNALEQAEKIIAFAEEEAMEFKEMSKKEFEKFLSQKEKAFSQRLIIEHDGARLKLRQQIAEEALEIVKKVLLNDNKEKKQLTQTALKNIKTLIQNPIPLKDILKSHEKNH